jgi:hypothetical protein
LLGRHRLMLAITTDRRRRTYPPAPWLGWHRVVED